MLGVTAVGIGYRVQEVREVADVEADLAFAKTLPTYDDTQAGRDLRRATSMVAGIGSTIRTARPDRPLPGAVRPVTGGPEPTYLEQLPTVLDRGWPDDRPDLKQWLDEMTASGWVEVVEAAALKPTGVFEDPAELAPNSPLRGLDGLGTMTHVYLARALQRQAAGDPAEMPRAVATWLSIVRTVRKDTLAITTLVSRGMESQVYLALHRWLERLDGRPDLLRAALAAVREHDRTDPFDPQAVRLAHQVVARNAVLAPSQWLPNYFDVQRQGIRNTSGIASVTAETEANLVGFAWTVPWERERLRRAVGLGNSPDRRREQVEFTRGMPGWSVFLIDDRALRAEFADGHKSVTAARRAAILKLAARLYEAETGAPPDSLARLVPKYLPEVPADPYDGQPFRYRLSAGETIQMRRKARDTLRPPPGIEGNVPEQHYMTAAGIVGGLMCWPLEPGWVARLEMPSMPGVFPEVISEAQITAVAGTVGGVVFWPHIPDWGFPLPPPTGDEVISGGVASGSLRWDPSWYDVLNNRDSPFPKPEPVEIAAGQGILWSVGPDQTDSGAAVVYEPGATGQQSTGDLVYLIPRPARPE